MRTCHLLNKAGDETFLCGKATKDLLVRRHYVSTYLTFNLSGDQLCPDCTSHESIILHELSRMRL